MEVIILLLEWLTKVVSILPTELMLGFILALLFYLVKRQGSFEKTVDNEFSNVRLQIEANQLENKQRDEEFQAALSKLSEDITAELKRQENNLHKSYMMTLRTAIMNDTFPKSYRLEKYDEYSKLGGNSFIDDHVRNKLLKESGE